MKKYPMPTLGLFHTFEVVARRQSFTMAADELCLTQGAISRQIKALEGHLDLSLFKRKHREIELTQEGADLYASVTRGLDEIYNCLEKFKYVKSYPQITVSASVAFAYYWLLPRLETFNSKHPDIDLKVLATDKFVDLLKDESDVAILYGNGHWDGVNAELLFGEKVYPVCSQSYLDKHPNINVAHDFQDQTLLHLEGGGNVWGNVDWRVWMATQGVVGSPVRRGIQLNSYPMVLQAAQAGRGIALGWSYITDQMIEEGQLICPIDAPIETNNGYYFGATPEKKSSQEVMAFMDWVKEELSEL